MATFEVTGFQGLQSEGGEKFEIQFATKDGGPLKLSLDFNTMGTLNTVIGQHLAKALKDQPPILSANQVNAVKATTIEVAVSTLAEVLVSIQADYGIARHFALDLSQSEKLFHELQVGVIEARKLKKH